MQLALYQGTPKVNSQRMAKQSSGKSIDRSEPQCDPTVIATSFGKSGNHRFFMFSRREPEESDQRDVYNEKPTMVSGEKGGPAGSGLTGSSVDGAKSSAGDGRLVDHITLHTSMGDLSLKLFPKFCPKTVKTSNALFKWLLRRLDDTNHQIFHGAGRLPVGDGTGVQHLGWHF